MPCDPGQKINWAKWTSGRLEVTRHVCSGFGKRGRIPKSSSQSHLQFTASQLHNQLFTISFAILPVCTVTWPCWAILSEKGAGKLSNPEATLFPSVSSEPYKSWPLISIRLVRVP